MSSKKFETLARCHHLVVLNKKFLEIQLYFILSGNRHLSSFICALTCNKTTDSHQDDVRNFILAREIGKYMKICDFVV